MLTVEYRGNLCDAGGTEWYAGNFVLRLVKYLMTYLLSKDFLVDIGDVSDIFCCVQQIEDIVFIIREVSELFFMFSKRNQ